MTDLSTLAKSWKPGQLVSLPKSTYSLAQLLIISAAGLTLQGNGSTLIAPASGSPFLLAGAKITVDGFVCAKSNTFCQSEAPNGTLSNCDLGLDSPAGSIQSAVMHSRQGGQNFKCINVRTGICSSYAFYSEVSGTWWIDCSALGSVGQPTCRWSSPDGKIVPANMLIQGGTFDRKGNAFGKQTFENRTGAGMWQNVTINGDTVTGQGLDSVPSYKQGQLGTLVVQGCTFQNRMAGNPFLSTRHGSVVQIDKTTKFLDPDPTSKTVVAGGGLNQWM